MSKKKTEVKGNEITLIVSNEQAYISLTDIAKHKTDDTSAVIGNWMRNRNAIEFLGIWEILYNPTFKPIEFEGFRNQAGLNAFTLSPKKWIETTNATFINDGLEQTERLLKLNQIAISQMQILLQHHMQLLNPKNEEDEL